MQVEQIFISHKSRDKAAAIRIRTTLKKYGGNGMDIFVSEQIEPGKEWPSEIWEHLLKADWLLLLYTDESEEWDWCLFDAGFFATKGKGCNEGLVCLHVTEVLPPKPLSLWQTVKVYEPDSMDGFVKKLYAGVNDEVVTSEDTRKQVGDEIAAAFAKTVRRRTERKYETKCLVLSLSPAQARNLIENRKKQYGEAEEVEIQKTLERLTFDLDWINGEAQRYGLELKVDVLAAFPDAADQEVIEDIIDNRWPLLMRKVYQGIQDRDLDLVLNVLNCMLVLNKTFMVRAAQRYCHLLQGLKEQRCEI